MNFKTLSHFLERIAHALEAHHDLAYAAQHPSWHEAKSWVWQAYFLRLKPVQRRNTLPPQLLIGIDRNMEILSQNTRQFAEGKLANNVLLWGARGTGKSALVKAVHADLDNQFPLHLIEIYREDLATMPVLLDLLASEQDKRFIIFCDDLSFYSEDSEYKSLKTVLEGGVEEKPENVIFYATSNRRHLIAREMSENEQKVALHPSEAIEEKVSLSDRFGLWLGFHAINQETFLKMVDTYSTHFDLNINSAQLHREALEWASTRGARSGRVAWQFIQDLRGRCN